jgi:hypothetical protein
LLTAAERTLHGDLDQVVRVLAVVRERARKTAQARQQGSYFSGWHDWSS